MTAPTSATPPSHNTNCFVCDNYVFDKTSISLDTLNGKIKLCCKLCFDKYDIALQQQEFRKRRHKAEKKEKE